MIPVALYGVDAEMCERFFDDLPGLVTDAYEDRSYIESLYAVQAEQSIEHISIADQWAERTPFAWPEDIVNEVEHGAAHHHLSRRVVARTPHDP